MKICGALGVILKFSLGIIILFEAEAQEDSSLMKVIGQSGKVSEGQQKLKGVVTSEEGQPVENATVYIDELKRGAITDEEGRYEIRLSPGEYTLIVRYLGLESFKTKISFLSEGTFDLSMEQAASNLEEVVITSERDERNVRDAITGIERLKIEEVKKLPTLLGEADILRTILLLPGVNTVGEGASGFNVRGGKVSHNLVTLNGAPLFNSSHILGLFSSFNADAIESFNLFKGHVPANYGGRLSSVLDVNVREGDPEKIKGNASIGLLTGKALIEGPIIKNKTTFLVSGRTSYSDWILRIPSNPDVRESSLSFYDITTMLAHRVKDLGNLKLSYYRSSDSFTFTDDFGFEWKTDLLTTQWKGTLSPYLGYDINGAYSTYRSTSFDPEGSNAFELETGIDYYTASSNLIYSPQESYSIKGGVVYTRYDTRPEELEREDDAGNTFQTTVDKEQAREMAGYLDAELNPIPLVSLSVGLRYSLFQNVGPFSVFSYDDGLPILERNITDTTSFNSGEVIARYSGPEPRVALRILLGQNNSIKVSYNLMRQYIHSVSNTTSPTPADVWQLSNTYFEPQVSDNYTIGYFHNFLNNDLETSLEGFYKDIDNQVEYKDFADLFLNDHLETELLPGEGEAYGVEFALKKKRGKWTGWLSYAFTRSLVRIAEPRGGETINNGNSFPSNFDQPHKFNLVATRKLGKKSAFSATFTYISGRPITTINSVIPAGPVRIPVFTERNQSRIPDYIRLDLSFTIADNIWKDRTVKEGRKYKDSMAIAFYNVLARKNAFSIFYRRPEDRRPIPAPFRLAVLGSIIPSITYKVEF